MYDKKIAKISNMNKSVGPPIKPLKLSFKISIKTNIWPQHNQN